MANALFRPPTPEMEEVEEEPCVEVRMEGGGVMATPFFSQDNGTTLIRGGTVVNHDKAEVADVLVQEGKIIAVGQDLELPAVSLVDIIIDIIVLILRERQWLMHQRSL